jgi:hypothetical protein
MNKFLLLVVSILALLATSCTPRVALPFLQITNATLQAVAPPPPPSTRPSSSTTTPSTSSSTTASPSTSPSNSSSTNPSNSNSSSSNTRAIRESDAATSCFNFQEVKTNFDTFLEAVNTCNSVVGIASCMSENYRIGSGEYREQCKGNIGTTTVKPGEKYKISGSIFTDYTKPYRYEYISCLDGIAPKWWLPDEPNQWTNYTRATTFYCWEWK